jgi:hypothetical protein
LFREAQTGLKLIKKRWVVLSSEQVALFFTQKEGVRVVRSARQLADCSSWSHANSRVACVFEFEFHLPTLFDSCAHCDALTPACSSINERWEQ